MCGIVAVMERSSTRTPPPLSEVEAALAEAQRALPGNGDELLRERLQACAEHVERANELLRGVPGVMCLAGEPSAPDRLERLLSALDSGAEAVEASLDAGHADVVDERLELVNAALVRLRDALWAVRHDRLRTASAAVALGGAGDGPAALRVFTQIAVALAAIDRLEVRGRDSAGLLVTLRAHGLDLSSPAVRGALDERVADPLFRSRAVRAPDGTLCFVYKAAAEIGELGDNVTALREAIAGDALLRMALGSDEVRATVLGHTRWASVGMISEANAHPLASEEEHADQEGPWCAAVLNGDVDNYADLKVSESLRIPPDVTTDAKVIPVMLSRRLAGGRPLADAFRSTAAAFEGSVAIAAVSAAAPDRLMLALRGSGQALYVGLMEDGYLVASEPYGLVEQARSYLRMDGEVPVRPGDPSTRGQVVVLTDAHAGTLEGVERFAYDGTPLPVTADELVRPEITTRDIDRGSFPHFLLKEISEAPRSFRKTLRGKLAEKDGRLSVVLGEETLPGPVREGLRGGRFTRVIVIGQGTAAVAGRSLAQVLAPELEGLPVAVEAMAATELSGFRMTDDMADTLVVAISQSGTTTDTNRTVELARSRGAAVVSIVNRRNSDLTDRSDGVLYTSDGRDVEMAVPSTKAFYAQVAAGFLLAYAIADELGAAGAGERSRVLTELRELPDAMERVLTQRKEIAVTAQRHAPSRRYWAIVGNGVNRIAAEEVRIKLSELCYKSIACDVTEDKKHIDLSAEPLILVCAAGLLGSNAEDVAKEVEIYRAHKAAPVVIASEGDSRFQAALEVIRVPAVHPRVAFVLSAMAGHLFGYEAALAIDAQARPFREARAAIEAVLAGGPDPAELLDKLRPALEPVATRFLEGLRTGSYDGHLEASAAVRLASLFRYAVGISPLDLYQVEHGKVGTPATVVEDLIIALTTAVDQLTRPVDAIKHQAKTVTVGISRADEALLHVRLVQKVLASGVSRDRLSYRALRTLAALDAAVASVAGYTTYRVEGDVAGDDATIQVVDRGGISRDLPSRTDRDARLRGTKHRVATEREVTVARGRSDGRTVVIVPEVKGTEVTGLSLLHVNFHDRLPAPMLRAVLEGYRDRYAALRDAVTETEPVFRDDLLAEVGVADILTEPVYVLADHWRSSGGGA